MLSVCVLLVVLGAPNSPTVSINQEVPVCIGRGIFGTFGPAVCQTCMYWEQLVACTSQNSCLMPCPWPLMAFVREAVSRCEASPIHRARDRADRTMSWTKRSARGALDRPNAAPKRSWGGPWTPRSQPLGAWSRELTSETGLITLKGPCGVADDLQS